MCLKQKKGGIFVKQTSRQIWEKVKENSKILDSCTHHDFQRILGSHRYKCSHCGGEVDCVSASYYNKGFEHGTIHGRIPPKYTFVISAFPGCGKSYCCQAYSDEFSMLDSDSSKFSWILDENGNSTGKRNPDFPNNYIEHIKDNIGKVDIIFVSSHDSVREALDKAKIKTIQIFPRPTMKNIWLDRLAMRKDSEKFIGFIDSNWDEFIDGIAFTPTSYVVEKVVLDSKMPFINLNYLEDLIHNKQFLGNKRDI